MASKANYTHIFAGHQYPIGHLTLLIASNYGAIIARTKLKQAAHY